MPTDHSKLTNPGVNFDGKVILVVLFMDPFLSVSFEHDPLRLIQATNISANVVYRQKNKIILWIFSVSRATVKFKSIGFRL